MFLKRFLIALIAFIIIFFSAFLLLRGYFLETAILKVQNKISEKYDANLVIGTVAFEGLARISLGDITLSTQKGDTLFACEQTAVSISLLRLLKGQPPVNNIIATNGFIHLRQYADSSDNFSFLVKSGAPTREVTKSDSTSVDYQKQVKRLWNRFFAVADFNFSINNFLLSWQTPVDKEQLAIGELTLKDAVVNFSGTDSVSGHQSGWEVNGIIDADNEIIHVEGKTVSGVSEEIPFFKKISGIRFFINVFGFSVSLTTDKSNELGMDIQLSAFSPGIHHWRISPDEVVLDSVRARLKLVFRKNSVQTGPETVFIINQLPVMTRLAYEKTDSTLIALQMDISDIPAQNFFNSLPNGLFTTLEGLKVKGALNYHLDFRANLSNPENLVFDSQLKKTDFKIIGYGAENFGMMNGTFTHAVREKDVIIRHIAVGPENPKFVPLEMISPLLINSVLTAEDGTFYNHKGFNEEAFRKSIATNIKEKRFARGGSTITMQLVKNVFLHRNKTISRKVEEALIVWLIENNYLVSKERMLEVYLNIIEWGPGIYGIGDAAEFYFAKHPASLSLEESIYLSSIIPRPKTFRYTFDKEGKMKEYLQGYFDLVAGRLLKKEIITQQTRDSLKYQIELKGPALQMVLPDSIPADSLFFEEPEDLF
ncbi:MAG: transglycosylase domain-containing protein [Bacteroidota bacterium]|nr:transglycosylase domain-containing protein [Bacteroidota bacterium]